MKWTDHVERYTAQFAAVGKLFDTEEPVVVTPGWEAADVYLVRGSYALQLEISREYADLSLYLVRLVDGKLPGKHSLQKYEDGTWCREAVQNIYGIQLKPHRNLRNNYCDETVTAQMNDRMEELLALVRTNPQPLLDILEGRKPYRPAWLPPDPKNLPPAKRL